MDTPIDVREQRRAQAGRFGLVGLGVALVVLVLLLTGSALKPSIRRSDLRTSIVGRGPIEASISATGLVVPEHEHVISSPVDTRVERILRRPGDEVAPEDPILLLDVSATRAELAELDDRLALKRNARERVRIDLANRLSELRGTRAIKALELTSLEIELERRGRSFEMGLETEELKRRAATDVGRTQIELGQLDDKLRHAKQSADAELEGLALELKMLERDSAESARRLELQAARAGAASGSARSVVTWIGPREGQAVQRGDELARVADLSSFRVEVTVSDVHAQRLRAGLAVIVRAGDARLRGVVTGIRPTVENGAMLLDVALDESSNPALRHNRRVDIEVVTESRADALLVARGSFPRVEGTQVAFVVRDGHAARLPIELGVSSFDKYEVRSGLAAGDEVIVSDMSAYAHAEEVRIK